MILVSVGVSFSYYQLACILVNIFQDHEMLNESSLWQLLELHSGHFSALFFVFFGPMKEERFLMVCEEDKLTLNKTCKELVCITG